MSEKVATLESIWTQWYVVRAVVPNREGWLAIDSCGDYLATGLHEAQLFPPEMRDSALATAKSVVKSLHGGKGDITWMRINLVNGDCLNSPNGQES